MISINPYEIILQIVNFGILYFLLKKFLAKPLSTFLLNRANSIKHNIDHAEDTKVKADKLLSEQKESLKAAHIDAQTIRKKAEESAEKELDTIIEKGKGVTDQMIAQAKKDIELQTNTAKKQLLEDVSQITLKVVEKFVANDLTDDQKKNKINQLVDQVVVGDGN